MRRTISVSGCGSLTIRRAPDRHTGLPETMELSACSTQSVKVAAVLVRALRLAWAYDQGLGCPWEREREDRLLNSTLCAQAIGN